MPVVEVGFGAARLLHYADPVVRDLALRALREASAELTRVWQVNIGECEKAAMCLGLALHIAHGERDRVKLVARAVTAVIPGRYGG